ncbi:MAG: biotin--[acetyl-CoA-carboxylase] ligase [Treponema sp.]|jgi:BirA family biotin operon repressor/biotin-[acetyl-CoA-carboxylase] ligase|nr:biotin--[acetyl-CoA-carboxylase] ligase [Treponema sp.]
MMLQNDLKKLDIKNPFNEAPIFYAGTVSSTMDVSRELEQENAPHGTVIVADFQKKGRGRNGRPWQGKVGENLVFTVLLRFGDFSAIPKAITLKTGLAAALAVEDFVALFHSTGRKGALSLSCAVKWPNDLMVNSKKIAGVLTESDGRNVFIGIGVNVGQTEFPAELREKAGSLALAMGLTAPVFTAAVRDNRFHLMELILRRLMRELNTEDWQERLVGRLYKRGELVRFVAGRAGSGDAVHGVLVGVKEDGSLLILPRGAETPTVFVTGELDVY